MSRTGPGSKDNNRGDHQPPSTVSADRRNRSESFGQRTLEACLNDRAHLEEMGLVSGSKVRAIILRTRRSPLAAFTRLRRGL